MYQKLTARNQMILGLVCLLLGFLSALLLRNPVCFAVGGVLCGLLFILHPVHPATFRSPYATFLLRTLGWVLVVASLIIGYAL
ncbi:MAG TPA: hypothetical protein DIT49_02955 [Clostridiales bacterium]|nr:hypothetical protein [Clostridiales bacterium]